MRHWMRSHLTYANVMATAAVFMALGGGTTAVALSGSNTVQSDDLGPGAQVKAADVAGNAVNGADVVDESLTGADIKNGQVKGADIGAGEVRGGNVANDNLSGADISPNSLKGGDIDEATLNLGDVVRARAFVDYQTCTGSPVTCTPAHSKGISSVTRESTGWYCVIAPGIDSSQTVAAVTLDYWNTPAPEGNASVMTRAGRGCGQPGDQGSGFRVVTERQPVYQLSADDSVAGNAEAANDVSFTILIP